MNLRVLKKDEVFGKNKLDIFNIYGTRCNITDFALLFAEKNSKELEARKYYQSRKLVRNMRDDIVNNLGITDIADFSNFKTKCICPRIVVAYHDIASNSKDIKFINNNIKEVICGEYPCDKVDDELGKMLEYQYWKTNLQKTKKIYHNYLYFNDLYLYEGKKYIQLYQRDYNLFSNSYTCWVEVKPVVWIVDIKKNIAITKDVIVAGIPSKYIDFEKDGYFTKFMDRYLANDLFEKIEIKDTEKEVIKNEINEKEFIDINKKIKTLRKRIDNIRK